MEFSEIFKTIEHYSGKVLLEHMLFGQQIHYCEAFKPINDEERLGLVLKGCEIFVSKPNIQSSKVYNNMFVVADDRLKITVIVNK